MQAILGHETTSDQEVPREAVLTEPAPGEFDFNEFFNLDKSVPGLASVSVFKTPCHSEHRLELVVWLWLLEVAYLAFNCLYKRLQLLTEVNVLLQKHFSGYICDLFVCSL